MRRIGHGTKFMAERWDGEKDSSRNGNVCGQ